MDPAKQRAIAAEGGRAAHAQGVAHEFDSEEARAAGRKGGQARSHRSAMASASASTQSNTMLTADNDRDIQAGRDAQGRFIDSDEGLADSGGHSGGRA
jgi:general stress protein YciG